MAGMIAAGLCPGQTWADAGNPSYLAAAKRPSGDFVLCGLDEAGSIVFHVPLPERGHAAAAHPVKPLAVAFARRPGTYALVIDCGTGDRLATLASPPGHHFSGHGVFSADGALLFTGENDYETAVGVVGVWDALNGYRRVGSFFSGGVGPHDIKLMPDGATLVVANGGIETHPDTGRTKLNLSTMQPNLSYLTLEGAQIETRAPVSAWHKLSIRHLSVRSDGLVAVACQWQGELSQTPPLFATHRMGEDLRFHKAAGSLERDSQGYLGSIAFSGDGQQIAMTAPRGNTALLFDANGYHLHSLISADVCGVAPSNANHIFTTGEGKVISFSDATTSTNGHPLAWDNHLVALTRLI